MFDPLFRWLESSAFSVWMRESESLFAFPGILAAHTIGLGLLAGLSGALALRLLGVAKGISPEAFSRFVPLMWIGLWMNLLSGIALLIGYPTKALTNPVFYLKLGLIAAGLAILRAILRRTGSGQAAMGITKVLAAALLMAWIATITAGRLLAYTYTWLSVDSVRR
jgi:uncharacterized membrane protein